MLLSALVEAFEVGANMRSDKQHEDITPPSVQRDIDLQFAITKRVLYRVVLIGLAWAGIIGAVAYAAWRASKGW